MRGFGLLSDDGDCVYLYETLDDLVEGVLGQRDLEAGEALVRLDTFTILATGPTIRVTTTRHKPTT